MQIIISLLPPYFLGKLLDKLSVGGSEFFLFSFLLFLVTGLDFLLNWFQNYLWFKMSFWSAKEVRNLVFDALMKVNGFSGGEHQRLVIARALVRDADIIIMDEPTSALDTALSEQIVEHLNNYLSQNETILIVVSHRPEILEICNKTIELT